jgi:hypothetical protein
MIVPTGGTRPMSRTDRTVGCRVTSEQYREVEEAARMTGLSVSEYLRGALFTETKATAAALEKARSQGYAAARSTASDELRALQAELSQAREASAAWHQRAQHLGRDVVITSQRVMIAVTRVLWSAPSARAELARLWACLDPADQQRMLPGVTEVILERVERVRDETPRYTRERDAETLTNASWLHRLLIAAGGELTPAARTAHETIVKAAGEAEVSLYRRGLRRGRVPLGDWASAMRSRWPLNPPMAPADDPPPLPPEPPPLDASTHPPIQGVGDTELPSGLH